MCNETTEQSGMKFYVYIYGSRGDVSVQMRNVQQLLFECWLSSRMGERKRKGAFNIFRVKTMHGKQKSRQANTMRVDSKATVL